VAIRLFFAMSCGPLEQHARKLSGCWGVGFFFAAGVCCEGCDSTARPRDSAATPLFDPAIPARGVRNLPLTVFQLKLKCALEKENR
jgi:hypothetical protein